MRNVAMIMLLSGLPIIGGCANTDPTANAHADYVQPNDVPIYEGFLLKVRDPIPVSETIGTFRGVTAGYTKLDAPGMNAISAYYMGALIDQGWKHSRTASEPSTTSATKERWKSIWTKGRDQTLTLTYEERRVIQAERERMQGELRVHIRGSQ